MIIKYGLHHHHRELHDAAEAADDPELVQFIDDEYLRESVREVKAAADLVSRVRRAGPGAGTLQLDLALQKKYGYGMEGATGAAELGGAGLA